MADSSECPCDATVARDDAGAAAAAAIRTLEAKGYTFNGGEYWKPPLGKDATPLLTQIDALRHIIDGYEALEADIVLSADWAAATPRLTQAQWDEVMRLQQLRLASRSSKEA